jgi:nitric oxide reductase NorD protein
MGRARTARPDEPQRYALLASAIAGRTVAVVLTERRACWTDGVTIHLDATLGADDQLVAVSVQASLIAAGSVDPALMRSLRRSTHARRYLLLEGHRALAASYDLLPRRAARVLDADIATQTVSAEDSLQVATSRRPLPAPPAVFGVLDARAAERAAARGPAAPEHQPRHGERTPLADVDEDGDQELGPDGGADPFSSPVGGGGFLGKWLQRLLKQGRGSDGGGPPGADTPTHRSRRGAAGRDGVRSRGAVSDDDVGDDAGADDRWVYPEWDRTRRRYRAGWCTVAEPDVPDVADAAADRPDVHALRRPLTRLGIGLDRRHRQPQGDDIDVDAAVEARVALRAGSNPTDAVYLDSVRRRRDLAVLVLLDVSGSAGEAGTVGQTVHEQQRTVAAALTYALHELGDRVALYAFQSQGRTSVNVMPVKRFDDGYDVEVWRRLAALVPGAYSRLGAAIRHGTAIMAGAGSAHRVMVVLSDGLAYDHGYERDYGAADARRALIEARRSGVGCLCLTVGAVTGSDELRRVFGTAAHASVPKPEHLADHIGPLFRAALHNADLRRRVS